MGPCFFWRIRLMDVSAGRGFSASVAVHDDKPSTRILPYCVRLLSLPPYTEEQSAGHAAASKKPNELENDAHMMAEERTVGIFDGFLRKIDLGVDLPVSLR